MGISEHFGPESYALRVDIFQNFYEVCQFFLHDVFRQKCFDTPDIYILLWSARSLKQDPPCDNFLGDFRNFRNFFFFEILLISQWCFKKRQKPWQIKATALNYYNTYRR